MFQHLEVKSVANPRVLLIDDCIDSVNLISTILSHYQCEMDMAFDGQDAIPLLQSESYDLVVLDWHMPKLNGYETLLMMEQLLVPNKKIQTRTPILLYTSLAEEMLTLPTVRNFKYVGCLNKGLSFSSKFRAVGNTLALL